MASALWHSLKSRRHYNREASLFARPSSASVVRDEPPYLPPKDLYAISLSHSPECKLCGNNLPPFVSVSHHVVVAYDPEDLLYLLSLTVKELHSAHLARLNDPGEYLTVDFLAALDLEGGLCRDLNQDSGSLPQSKNNVHGPKTPPS